MEIIQLGEILLEIVLLNVKDFPIYKIINVFCVRSRQPRRKLKIIGQAHLGGGYMICNKIPPKIKVTKNY